MKIIIEKEKLVDTLQKVVGPTTTKQNFPSLNSVLITVYKDKVTFITTDLDITIISSLKAQIIETGKIAVPMKRFFSIIRELPSQEVTIEKTKNNLLIRCGKIEFKIQTLNPEEFPQVQEEKGVSFIKVDSSCLEEMIRLTAFCVGHEDVNYVLNGVLFEISENKVNLISTDGKRLSFVQKNLSSGQADVKTKISFVLPIKAVNDLYKLIKDKEGYVYLFTGKNKVGFDFQETQFIIRPIEGEFPPYSQYIPEKKGEKLTVNRNELLFALRRANVLSTTDYQGVKFELNKNELILSKNTPQLGEGKEAISVKYTGGNITIGFNPNYLIDVLKNMDDEEVNIEFLGVDKPSVLRKEGYLYLLLPMKL